MRFGRFSHSTALNYRGLDCLCMRRSQKRHEDVAYNPDMGTKIIIGVPGAWATRTDIVTSIVEHSGGFIFAGLVLFDTATKQGSTLEVYEHDPWLHEAFRIAGGGRFSDAEISAIAKHHHTLYCLSSSVSLEA